MAVETGVNVCQSPSGRLSFNHRRPPFPRLSGDCGPIRDPDCSNCHAKVYNCNSKYTKAICDVAGQCVSEFQNHISFPSFILAKLILPKTSADGLVMLAGMASTIATVRIHSSFLVRLFTDFFPPPRLQVTVAFATLTVTGEATRRASWILAKPSKNHRAATNPRTRLTLQPVTPSLSSLHSL